jgi:Putative MetA-pathway of phenol degradation
MRPWAGSQGLVHPSVRSARDEVLANFSIRWLGAVIGVVLMSGVADAQEKSQFTLFNPTPPDQMRSFSTDRPTKSNVPYTVPAGHFQYEGDLFIYSYNDTSAAGTTTRSWVVGNPTFKVGLFNNADFEMNFSAFNSIQSTTRSTGATSGATGIGDTVTRAKINFFGNDGGPAALAVIPYVKWPTAPQGIGNKYVEGGIIAPLALSLPFGFTTILMAEVDYLKNPNDNGYHVNIPALINISRAVLPGVTAYSELYANWSTNPQVPNVYTADFALAWSPRPNLQFDIGVNIGLVPAATPFQIYAGIAQRF